MANRRTSERIKLNFRHNGRYYTAYGFTRREAEEKKYRKIMELEEGAMNRDRPTLALYYEAFAASRRSKVKASTILNQRKWFTRCASVPIPGTQKTLGELRMADISPRDVKHVQAVLEESGLSATSVNDYMAHLSHVFAEAVKDETVDRNPCRCIDKVMRKGRPASETKHRALTVEETALFFSGAEKSFFMNAYKLMIQTGLRIGEVAALSLEDIDDRQMSITKTASKNENGTHMISDTAKTAKSRRIIPLTDTTRRIIAEQRAFISSLFGDDMPRLFPSVRGDILKEYTINRDIRRICASKGIDPFTCHAFRSTFATRWIEQRPQDYKILSEVLGHASTRITLDLYTHVMEDRKSEAMGLLDIRM